MEAVQGEADLLEIAGAGEARGRVAGFLHLHGLATAEPISTAMMAITTSSSISVNACRCGLGCRRSQGDPVKRAAYARGPVRRDVRINHRRVDVHMAEAVPGRSANVVAHFQQVCGEAVAQRMTTGALVQPRRTDDLVYGPLDGAGVDVVTTAAAGARVVRPLSRGEKELPAEGIGRLSGYLALGRRATKPGLHSYPDPVGAMARQPSADLLSDGRGCGSGQHDDAVLVALTHSTARPSTMPFRSTSLTRQAAAFHEAESSAVHEAGHPGHTVLRVGNASRAANRTAMSSRVSTTGVRRVR